MKFFSILLYEKKNQIKIESEESKTSISIHSNPKLFIHHKGLPILHKQKKSQTMNKIHENPNNSNTNNLSQKSQLLKAYLNRHFF